MRTPAALALDDVRGAKAFDEMTSSLKEMRAQLSAFHVSIAPKWWRSKANNGTRKWLLRLPSGDAFQKAHEVECVYIPETERGATLCDFLAGRRRVELHVLCHTARNGWCAISRPAKWSARCLVARDRLNDWADRETPTRHGRLTNVVMMGMGRTAL